MAHAVQVALDDFIQFAERIDAESFTVGVLAGIVGTIATIAGIFGMFFKNIRRVGLDGTNMGSSGGLVMPSFFFVGAQDIYSNVRDDSLAAQRRFKETGCFEDLYSGIQRSQENAVARSIEALRERFPPSATRELVFGAIRAGATSSTRLAADLYDFALRLQRRDQLGSRDVDILNELWSLDEARSTVSGRRQGEGGRRPWINPNAEILIDQQVAAMRRTVADIARRPLFAHVAPEVLARNTNLALVRLFDVFQPSDPTRATPKAEGEGYNEREQGAIDMFLEEVVRTPVMRCAFRHVAMLVGEDLSESDLNESWKDRLMKIWFRRHAGRPCVFEHVFLGNQCQDSSGQPIAGGLHCWLKFYLEEVRGTANYLGYVYNVNPEDGLRDHRFISGKFVWDFEGCRLVKDQGGFFVGTSPEWQLACGTIAFFETANPELAQRSGWEPWPGARGVGYTKDALHDGFRYRHIVCCDIVGKGDQAELVLCTAFANFLGAARAPEADADTQELDRVQSAMDIARKLPTWLVTEGIALVEDSQLCKACVEFCGARGCRSLSEALKEVRGAFVFQLEDAVAAANAEGFPRIRALVEDTREVAQLLLDAIDAGVAIAAEVAIAGAAAGAASAPAAVQGLSSVLPGLLKELKRRGRRGPRLHQPLRLLLTGRAEGAPVTDIFALLELAQTEGGDEVGVLFHTRIALVRELFPRQEPFHSDASHQQDESFAAVDFMSDSVPTATVISRPAPLLID